MEIFLMVLSLSLAGVLVSAVLFAAASREARAAAAPASGAADERFFVMRPAAALRRPQTPMPAEVLALQIAHHVRLEQAAAELFRQFPTAESLHTPTLSPLAG